MQSIYAAYIHIPFCRRRCFYCDFPISVLGEKRRGEDSGSVAAYVALLCQEIRATPVLGGPLKTVFLGGGTPSLLAVGQLEQILQTLQDHFGIRADAEISMEMDPGTFDLAHVQGYVQAGVNRISLGVQSFQDAALAACGRFHRVADVDRAVTHLQGAGVTNWSLDLISGLPRQTLGDWEKNLVRAIALRPTHLSVYDLTIEPQTPFGRTYRPGIAPLPTDTDTLTMLRQAQQVLTAAGYDHYEISNYAQPGYQCQHNRIYWENRPHYGFGMGATSYTQHQRVGRPRTRQAYAQWVEAYIKRHGQLDCPETPQVERVLDGLMTGLRLAEGVSLTPVQNLGQLSRVRAALQPHLDNGLAMFTQTSAGPHLRLSDPDGFFLSNTVIVSLFEALAPDFPPEA
ncbi:MAG: radical SAM family heme chaperone HemW [Cyanobacteria bacterium P01_A01_bin.105]